MSYVFDIIGMVWRDTLSNQIKDKHLALLFGEVLEEIHDVSHRLKDAINHDSELRLRVKDLADYVRQSKPNSSPQRS